MNKTNTTVNLALAGRRLVVRPLRHLPVDTLAATLVEDGRGIMLGLCWPTLPLVTRTALATHYAAKAAEGSVAAAYALLQCW